MEQKHARAPQNIVRTHPPFSKMTWRLQNWPGNMTSFLTDGRTDTNRDLTPHSSEQKTGLSELWNLMTSRIVCCLATLGSNNIGIELFHLPFFPACQRGPTNYLRFLKLPACTQQRRTFLHNFLAKFNLLMHKSIMLVQSFLRKTIEIVAVTSRATHITISKCFEDLFEDTSYLKSFWLFSPPFCLPSILPPPV